jgi:cytochrome P450
VAPTAGITVDDIQLGTQAFWAAPLDERDRAFAALRDRCPVAFHPELYALPGVPEGPGFWSVTRYEDVRSVNRRPGVFSSASGITLNETTPETLEFFGSMIVMDDPRHAKLRLLVQKGFTPKTVAAVEQSVRTRARALMVQAADMGTCDFVATFAAPLPLQVICDMLGVPAADEKQIFDWTNVILGVGDPDFGAYAALLESALGMYNYAQALGQERLEHPGDDLVSLLMHAEVEGQRLTPAEFGSFFILLAVAGNETTRNAIAHGMNAFLENPDQWALLVSDPDRHMATTVEEILRWASPVLFFRRNARKDVTLSGQTIRAGEKISLWYISANRDEAIFDDPFRFDITRDPNPHIAFGGGGPHFCLGAQLARLEIRLLFDELARRVPRLEQLGEPERLRSNFIGGIKHLPVRLVAG